jgi:VWFA-related protein
MGRLVSLAVASAVVLGVVVVVAQQGSEPIGGTASRAEPAAASIRITSPLGRTGVAGKVRIVAQLQGATERRLGAVSFFVDGTLVGVVDEGPPYVVEWTDENPFEQREILVQTADDLGRTIRDTVILPPFQITDRGEVTSILLETGVYDKDGRFLAQLDPKAFNIRENGVPQKVDLIERETLPTNLVLLVDTSQSMSRRMDFVRRASERLVTALHPRDRVIVVPFNTRVGSVTGPTNDAPTIAEAIGAMRASGGTAVLDALVESTRLLQGAEGRRAIILITDGYDENSSATVDEVLKAAEAEQVTIYGIGIGGVAGISLRGEDMLKRLANDTGGRVFFPPREPDLVTVADSVATDADSRYLITYTPTNQKKDGTWREIAVDVPGAYRVRTRTGYLAPSPPPIRPVIEFAATNLSHTSVDVALEDLEVVEDGVPQNVDTFQEAVDPVAIVMALDSSGSMKNSADLVRRTARDFVVAVRPQDSLALITFADKPLFSHVLATNRQWTLDAIEKYLPNGGTALYDALWNSLVYLKPVSGRRAVVVMTDGRDEDNPGTGPGSTHTLDDVLKIGREVGAMIFTVGVGTKVDGRVLERVAAETGGESYFASDASQLGDQFHRIVDNLRRRYVLSYTSTNFDHNGKWRKVEIRPRNREFVIASGGGYLAPDR